MLLGVLLTFAALGSASKGIAGNTAAVGALPEPTGGNPAAVAPHALSETSAAVTPKPKTSKADIAASAASFYQALRAVAPADGCPPTGYYSPCSVATPSQCNGFESCCMFNPPLQWWGELCRNVTCLL